MIVPVTRVDSPVELARGMRRSVRAAIVSWVCLVGCSGGGSSQPETTPPGGGGAAVDCTRLPTIQEPHNSVNSCPKDADGKPIAGKLCGEILQCYVGFCPQGVSITQADAAAFRACLCAGPPLVELLKRCGG